MTAITERRLRLMQHIIVCSGVGRMGALRKICLLALFAVCCLAGGPALAEKRVALVIGNGAYRNMPKLANPPGDAQAVSARLKSVGFEVTEGTDLTQDKMTTLMLEFEKTAVGADVALVYYAGQGVVQGESNYLVPIDADIKLACDLQLGAAINLNMTTDRILGPAKVKLVFVDAPRTNRFPAETCGPPRAGSRVSWPENSLIMLDTGPGQGMLDVPQGGHSPLAQALLENLAVPGVEIVEMMVKMRARVVELTNGGRLPWANSNLMTPFYLNPKPPPAFGANAGGSPAVTGQRIALVIGNGAYQNLRKFDNSVRDAQTISAVLKSIGFKVTEGTDLTRDKMTALMRDFGKTTAGADIALIYYSGQGIALDDAEYLLPVDANIKTESDIRLGATIDLNAAIDQLLFPAKVKVVFVDASRINPFPGKKIARPPGFPGSDAADPAPNNALIVFGAAPGEEIVEGPVGGHAAFTRALLEYIGVPGLEIMDMMKKVDARVSELTNKAQDMRGTSTLSTPVYLTPKPTAAAGAK